ncbi:MAG: hypothetical protein ACXAC7_23700 [Candidatus Hodarchaeales archaeon]|jgi:hypothetical protein
MQKIFLNKVSNLLILACFGFGLIFGVLGNYGLFFSDEENNSIISTDKDNPLPNQPLNDDDIAVNSIPDKRNLPLENSFQSNDELSKKIDNPSRSLREDYSVNNDKFEDKEFVNAVNEVKSEFKPEASSPGFQVDSTFNIKGFTDHRMSINQQNDSLRFTIDLDLFEQANYEFIGSLIRTDTFQVVNTRTVWQYMNPGTDHVITIDFNGYRINEEGYDGNFNVNLTINKYNQTDNYNDPLLKFSNETIKRCI